MSLSADQKQALLDSLAYIAELIRADAGVIDPIPDPDPVEPPVVVPDPIPDPDPTPDPEPDPDPIEPVGLYMLSPVAGYVATSPDVGFEWLDDTDPDKIRVYDLHVYSDAARTKKVTGTNGVLFDTNGIGTANSHTFEADPSDGGKRYGLLWQWAGKLPNKYDPATRVELLFEYTAFDKTAPDTKLEPVKGFKLTVPSRESDSPKILFGEATESNPNAVYDLQMYSDKARSNPLDNADGSIFKTAKVDDSTQFQINADHEGSRYGVLSQWAGMLRDESTRKDLWFEYDADTKHIVLSPPDTGVEPAAPQPADPATLRILRIKQQTGNDVLFEIGFDKNRNCRIESTYTSDGSGPVVTASPNVDTTGKWGAPGLEHNQWLRGLKTVGMYSIQPQTQYSDLEGWHSVGDPLVIENDPPQLPGYTSFLTVEGLSDYGTITNSKLNTMVKPLVQFWKADAVDVSRLSTTVNDGYPCLGVKLEPTPEGVNGSNRFAAGFKIRNSREVWVSQWILHPADTEWGGEGRNLQVSKTGVGIFGGDAVASEGESQPNGCSARIITRGLGADGRAEWGLFIYTGGQVAGTHGAEIYNLNLGKPLIVEPKWTHHLLCMTLNTKRSLSDGVLAHWVDGNPTVMTNDMRWLATGKLIIDNLVVGNWYGGDQKNGNYAPSKTQYRYLRGWKYKSIL